MALYTEPNKDSRRFLRFPAPGHYAVKSHIHCEDQGDFKGLGIVGSETRVARGAGPTSHKVSEPVEIVNDCRRGRLLPIHWIG